MSVKTHQFVIDPSNPAGSPLGSARTLFEIKRDSQGRKRVSSQFDGDTTLFLEQHLTQIETQVLRTQHQPLDGLDLQPIETDLKLGTKFLEYYQRTSSGKAAVVTGQTQQVEHVDLATDPEKEAVRMIAVGFPFDIQEEAAAADNMINLAVEGGQACREILDHFVDEVAIQGKPEHKLFGFLRGGEKGARSAELANPITSESSADNDIAALNGCVSAVINQSRGLHRPNRLALSLRTFNLLAEKHIASTGISALEYFLKNNPGNIRSMDQIKPLFGFQEAMDGKDVIAAYVFDPSVVRMKIMPPRQLKIVETLFGSLLLWVAMVSPVQYKQPLGCAIRRYTHA